MMIFRLAGFSDVGELHHPVEIELSRRTETPPKTDIIALCRPDDNEKGFGPGVIVSTICL